MRLISVRDWPFGNEVAQGDRVCGSSNDASGGVRRKRRQTLSVADGADGQAVIAVVADLALRLDGQYCSPSEI
jgi:hypothetical protein